MSCLTPFSSLLGHELLATCPSTCERSSSFCWSYLHACAHVAMRPSVAECVAQSPCPPCPCFRADSLGTKAFKLRQSPSRHHVPRHWLARDLDSILFLLVDAMIASKAQALRRSAPSPCAVSSHTHTATQTATHTAKDATPHRRP